MTDLNKLDSVFEKVEAPDIKLLREIGKRIGFGRACQILGKQWKAVPTEPIEPIEKLSMSMCVSSDYMKGWNDCVDAIAMSAAKEPK